MANELNALLKAGSDATARVFTEGWIQQGGIVAMTEAYAGHFTGDFDLTTLADGKYAVVFYEYGQSVLSGNLVVADGVESDGNGSVMEMLDRIDTRTISINAQAGG